MKNLYVYIENEDVANAIKYGMKLSIFANTVLNISNKERKGIKAYLSPKDSELYFNYNYTCLRITINEDLNVIIYNQVCEETIYFDDFIKEFNDYEFGEFEEPIALICSTILPENIFEYNKTIDFPLLVENSKQFYYEKCINNMIENCKFTKSELYQMLLILGEQKKVFKLDVDNKLRIYKDTISNKTYTRKLL